MARTTGIGRLIVGKHWKSGHIKLWYSRTCESLGPFRIMFHVPAGQGIRRKIQAILGPYRLHKELYKVQSDIYNAVPQPILDTLYAQFKDDQIEPLMPLKAKRIVRPSATDSIDPLLVSIFE